MTINCLYLLKIMLKDKVADIVKQYGYKTSYADNMLHACEQVGRNVNYAADEESVVKLPATAIERLINPNGLSWTLKELQESYLSC